MNKATVSGGQLMALLEVYLSLRWLKDILRLGNIDIGLRRRLKEIIVLLFTLIQ